MRIISLKTINSTNDFAKKLALNNSTTPLWVISEKQTSGRGRSGRQWYSQEGNLFTSGLYFLEIDIKSIGNMSFIAALALYDSLIEFLPNDLVKLKWPNDVLVDGKKISGILIETIPNPEGFFIVIGIGVNIKTKPSELNAACLMDYAENFVITPDKLLQSIVKAFDYYLEDYISHGFSKLRSQWLDKCIGLGKDIIARTANKDYEGIFRDLGSEGELLLEDIHGNIVPIFASEVFIKN